MCACGRNGNGDDFGLGASKVVGVTVTGDKLEELEELERESERERVIFYTGQKGTNKETKPHAK